MFIVEKLEIKDIKKKIKIIYKYNKRELQFLVNSFVICFFDQLLIFGLREI